MGLEATMVKASDLLLNPQLYDAHSCCSFLKYSMGFTSDTIWLYGNILYDECNFFDRHYSI